MTVVDHDSVADAVLEAARASVLALGVRRTTLTEVARRSGRSRPTIYSRWRDVRSLIGDLLTREMRSVISDTIQSIPEAPESVRPVLVRELARLAAEYRENPLLRKIVDVDPELMLPYLFERLGTSQLDALRVLEPWLEAGQRDGSIRPGDPAALARMVLLTTQSVVLSGKLVADRLPADALTSELEQLLERYLRP